MTVRLRLKEHSTIPVSVKGVSPNSIDGLSVDEISQLPVMQGNRKVQLKTLFEINQENEDESGVEPNREDEHNAADDSSDLATRQKLDASREYPHLVWEGNLSHVHWIGAAMTGGQITIDGSAGRHLGSQISGGQIHVNGDVGDFVGCEMTGGAIKVSGNAADWVGAAYPGNDVGVNRGQIVIAGDAGRAAGMAMRRGTICIGGSVGPLAGWNMRAGTLLLGGQTGEMLGKGMRRGTILLAKCSGAGFCPNLPPTFTFGGDFQSAALMALARWASKRHFPVNLADVSQMQIYHGDHLYWGRGEVLVACDMS